MNGRQKSGAAPRERRLPRINFRPLLFCAVGMCLGIFLYMRIRFGGLVLSDFLFFGGFLLVALFSVTRRRAFSLVLCVLLFAGMGAGLSHLYTQRYETGASDGTYEVEGTVCEFVALNGRTEAVLTDLLLDGKPVGGKMSVIILSEEAYAGNIMRFIGKVKRSAATSEDNFYAYTSDIRYTATDIVLRTMGKSNRLLLRLSSALYRTLSGNMPEEEAELSYALLTGNSRVMDKGVLQSVREGGIAHIFAVSGLHIGIVYAAAAFLFFPLKRWKAVPALAVAVCYAAMCGFSVSVLRAVIMCGVHAVGAVMRRKTDFLNTISVAAIAVLLLFPADWLSAGFRLSFGACIGLALFSGTISRTMRRLHCPAAIAGYFSASVSVQIFTVPILMESFGYVSVWGMLLNLVLIPVLPAFFLGILVPTLFALIIPSAAEVFLAVPYGLTAAFTALLAELDLSLVVTGVTLGSAGTVWMAACVALSERFRVRPLARCSLAAFFCVLLAVCLAVESAPPAGCTVKVRGEENICVYICTERENVLLLGSRTSLSDCESLLPRGEALNAVIVVAENGARAVNVAAYLGAAAIYAPKPFATGLWETPVYFTEDVAVGGLRFRFENAHKLVLFAEDVVVEFDFEGKTVLSADLAVEKGAPDLNFFLRHGIIEVL